MGLPSARQVKRSVNPAKSGPLRWFAGLAQVLDKPLEQRMVVAADLRPDPVAQDRTSHPLLKDGYPAGVPRVRPVEGMLQSEFGIDVLDELHEFDAGADFGQRRRATRCAVRLR